MQAITTSYAPAPSADASRERPFVFAITSTAVWLILGGYYIGFEVGWQAFLRQRVDSLGGFLEGAFAPLAFLWLVVGSFLQQRELRQNNVAIYAQYEEMRRTALSSETQARAIEANAMHQQQETTLLVADRVQRQIGSTIGMLWMSSQGAESANVDGERIGALWNQHGSGDAEIFARAMVALHFAAGDDAESRALFFGTVVRTRHSNTIRTAFERLLELIRRCDPDGILEDAFLGSGTGRVYQLICELNPGTAQT